MVFKQLIKNRKSKKDKASDDYIVALDIGTEFVKALIARLDGEVLDIVGMGRVRQSVSDMHNGAIADITGVVRNCELALSQAEDQAGLQAKRVVIGIAGELVKGSTDTIRYKRPQRDRPLDSAEINFIINKAQDWAQKKAQKQIALETGNPDVEVKLINSALVSIHIDGYKVSNPLGFQGHDVAVQLYTAFAPMVHIGALEKVAEELSLRLMAVAAEPFAASRSVLGNDASNNLTAIIVDIGGGTTDIALVNDGGVEGTKSFSIGGRSITQTIARDLGLSYDDAEKLKLNIDNEDIKSTVREKVNNSIDKILEVWMSGVELALSEFESSDHLPNRILLCGGGSSLEKVYSNLKFQNWHSELPFSRKPSIQYVRPEDVIKIKDSTGLVNDHTFITAMGLLRVGYDTIIGGSGGDSIKEKLNRLLRI